MTSAHAKKSRKIAGKIRQERIRIISACVQKIDDFRLLRDRKFRSTTKEFVRRTET